MSQPFNTLLKKRDMNAAVVNISGRQRMLSQRAAMFALQIAMSDAFSQERQQLQQELRSTIELMDLSHRSLLEGNPELNLPGNPSPTVRTLYFEPPTSVDSLVRTFIQKAKRFCEASQTQDCLMEDLNEIVHLASGALLRGLDAVVTQYQAESDAEQWSAQTQLIQAEKMSSLGRLVAGVAHEINNPVNFIHGNLSYAKTYAKDLLELIELYRQHCSNMPTLIEQKAQAIDLDFLLSDFTKVLDSMQLGTDRIRQLVRSLRNFSRTDEAQMQTVDIHEGLESTLLILKHQLQGNGDRPSISLVKQYGDLPPVECYPGQLNQAFMNILSNAIDALQERNLSLTIDEIQKNPSTIKIQTTVDSNEWVHISIADNGMGIPSNIQERIFESFFTTKPVGKGTGLGLSISHHVVTERHAGKLCCLSQPGIGTEFRIEIPIKAKSCYIN